MKRIGIILSLSIMIVLSAASFCFAQGLTLESVFPEEGTSNLTMTNVAVKLKFSENMTSEEAQAANEDCFKITNEKGKKISYRTLYNAKKYPDEIWLQITDTLENNTEYKLVISGKIVSSAGNTLDDGQTLHFSTRDSKQDNNVYMIMMLLMVVGMVVFTSLETRHKLKKEMAEKQTAEDFKVNPYKEAKKTGKSVEEIIAKTEHEKAKAEKHRQKAEKEAAEEAAEARAHGHGKTAADDGRRKVKAKKPISAAGVQTPQSIIEKNKARAEAKAKEQARKNAHSVSKSKGSKQQQRKKK